MDEESIYDQAQFEAALRRLSPNVMALSAEETFYEAGWQAACRTNASLSQVSRRSMRGFVVGLAFGLMVSVTGLQLWPAQRQAEDHRDGGHMRSKSVLSTEPAHTVVAHQKTDSDVDTVNGSGELDEVFRLLTPASWLAVTDGDLQPLPLAMTGPWAHRIDVESLVEHRWRRAKSSKVNMPGYEVVEPPAVLRAYPLCPDVLDEWL